MKRSRSIPQFAQPVLPFDVRFALRYKEAQMRAEDVMCLAMGMPSLCLYGVSKFLQTGGFLDRFPAVLDSFLSQDVSQFSLVARTALAGVDHTVAMPKLAEHSRRFLAIDEAYKSAGRACPVDPTYLMAHSTLVGIKPYCETRASCFGVLYEPVNPDDQWVSITVDPATLMVSDVKAAGSLPPGAMVLDDIANSGNTEQIVHSAYPDTTFGTVFNQ